MIALVLCIRALSSTTKVVRKMSKENLSKSPKMNNPEASLEVSIGICFANMVVSDPRVGVLPLLVKKLLKFDYPPPKEVAFRQIYGYATTISKI